MTRFVFETKRRPKGWFDAQAQDFAAGADMTTLDAEAMRGSFTAEGAATGTVESRVGINRFAILGAMIEGDKIVFTPSEVQKAKKRVLIAMTVAIPDALVELPENPNGFAALTLAQPTIGYAIKTSAG